LPSLEASFSARVREDASGKLALEVDDLGVPELKNIATKIEVSRVRSGMSERRDLPLPDKPSIAVLPFTNMSGDPEQDYFADGIVEDIITSLSRVRWLFVTPALSTKGRPSISNVWGANWVFATSSKDRSSKRACAAYHRAAH